MVKNIIYVLLVLLELIFETLYFILINNTSSFVNGMFLFVTLAFMPNAFYPAGIMLYNNYYYNIIIGMRIVVCKWSIRTLKSST